MQVRGIKSVLKRAFFWLILDPEFYPEIRGDRYLKVTDRNGAILSKVTHR